MYNDGTTVIDQAGLSAGSAYLEGTPLSPLTSNLDQGYARTSNGCNDTNNNSADFLLTNPSNPQNSSSPIIPCLYVTGVDSTKSNGTYTSGEVIDIDVTFSNNVNVTGSPVLLLETGPTDRNAVYSPDADANDGDAITTFRYTVSSTDSSIDLDYVSTTALSLNGGMITGAVGDALLDLPMPGASGSLGDSKNIQIDAVGSPTLVSIRRQTPSSTPTNVDTLVFRATFSEVVNASTVTADDFIVTGSTAAVSLITSVNGYTFDLTISGGDLAALSADVGINISLTANVTDLAGNAMLTTPEPSIDEIYTVDNTLPTIISINQLATQPDPTSSQPILFEIVFSEPIVASTLAPSDIGQNGSISSGLTWYISNTVNPAIFNLSATVSGNSSNSGTVIPTMSANAVNDLAGNNNDVFAGGSCLATEPNNCVQLNVTDDPTVTITQAAGQPDPTSALPINFTVQFSEPINTATFTPADITQTGTAASVVWNIANSGDNTTFTLSAVSSGYGTVAPIIEANKVLDLSGNNNTASNLAPTDNSVEFLSISARAVIINEAAWAGTASGLTGDEWIELHNTTGNDINITGWTLRASDGTPSITLAGTIAAGGYFLLERDDNDTVSDVDADQIYTGELSNSGESLTLRDGASKVIDTANGNGGSWPAGSASTYGTMERKSASADSDSNWQTNTGIKKNGKNANGGDILGTPRNSNTPLPVVTVTPKKTETPTPRPSPIPIPPRPILNEILARPGFDWNQDGKADVFDEFIEIKNLTAIDISLNGWKINTLNGGKTFALPEVKLKPGERIVLYGKQTNLLLSDGGETVRLVNSSGKIYDAFTYNLARAEDASFCRLPDGAPGNSWFEDCVPTPNLANTREGKPPAPPDGGAAPACNLPDTVPPEILIPECHGYGADIWNPFYWDFVNWIDKLWIQQANEKWRTFIE